MRTRRQSRSSSQLYLLAPRQQVPQAVAHGETWGAAGNRYRDPFHGLAPGITGT